MQRELSPLEIADVINNIEYESDVEYQRPAGKAWLARIITKVPAAVVPEVRIHDAARW